MSTFLTIILPGRQAVLPKGWKRLHHIVQDDGGVPFQNRAAEPHQAKEGSARQQERNLPRHITFTLIGLDSAQLHVSQR
jgi:hypothetical protein